MLSSPGVKTLIRGPLRPLVFSLVLGCFFAGPSMVFAGFIVVFVGFIVVSDGFILMLSCSGFWLWIKTVKTASFFRSWIAKHSTHLEDQHWVFTRGTGVLTQLPGIYMAPLKP